MTNLFVRYRCYATIYLCITLLASWQTGQASDIEREQRLAEQSIDAILDGDPVMLTADNHDFLAIIMASQSSKNRGAVIILHGRGMHPDWHQVTAPLRIALPDHGWTTLSLQLPVLDKQAKYYDYLEIFPEALPRIEAGIRYLQKNGHDRIVLIAHSCGVHMAMAWLDRMGDAEIDGFIGIGMGATDYQQPMPEPFPYEKIHVPLLSIYGSEDYPAVHRRAAQLEPLLNDMPLLSDIIMIPGADHYFEDYEEGLINAATNWLEELDLIRETNE